MNRLYFGDNLRWPLPKSEPVHREKIIVQVKGGSVNRGDVATLLGAVENQKVGGEC